MELMLHMVIRNSASLQKLSVSLSSGSLCPASQHLVLPQDHSSPVCCVNHSGLQCRHASRRRVPRPCLLSSSSVRSCLHLEPALLSARPEDVYLKHSSLSLCSKLLCILANFGNERLWQIKRSSAVGEHRSHTTLRQSDLVWYYHSGLETL